MNVLSCFVAPIIAMVTVMIRIYQFRAGLGLKVISGFTCGFLALIMYVNLEDYRATIQPSVSMLIIAADLVVFSTIWSYSRRRLRMLIVTSPELEEAWPPPPQHDQIVEVPKFQEFTGKSHLYRTILIGLLGYGFIMSLCASRFLSQVGPGHSGTWIILVSQLNADDVVSLIVITSFCALHMVFYSVEAHIRR